MMYFRTNNDGIFEILISVGCRYNYGVRWGGMCWVDFHVFPSFHASLVLISWLAYLERYWLKKIQLKFHSNRKNAEILSPPLWTAPLIFYKESLHQFGSPTWKYNFQNWGDRFLGVPIGGRATCTKSIVFGRHKISVFLLLEQPIQSNKLQ